MSRTEKAGSDTTARMVSPEVEEWLGRKLDCLDHGFIYLVDYMGGDAAIVQAARVSYGLGTKTVHEDRGLIRYLMRHRHTTPFEMVELKFHVKLPIFVARQWIRHRTASVNEYSGRYSVMTDESYLPRPEHVTEQSAGNRQGGAGPLDATQAAKVIAVLEAEQRLVREGYHRVLGWDVRRELARINLGLAQYTEWYWKSDLLNIFRFLSLRLDEHAQYEIRVYAEAMAQIVRAVVPIAWEAFEDYELRAVRFSRLEMDSVARLLRRRASTWPEDVEVLAALPEGWQERNPDGSLKRNRERDEFLAKLKRLAAER